MEYAALSDSQIIEQEAAEMPSDDEDDDINDPEAVEQKADQVADLLTIFIDRVDVKFKRGRGEPVVETGQWCTICR